MKVNDVLAQINVTIEQIMFDGVIDPYRAMHLLNLAADTLEQVARERDAALADWERFAVDGEPLCWTCKYCEDGICLSPFACDDGECWEWRGVPQDVSNDKRGLYGKYIITKSDGTPVNDRCFVLKPDKDPAAVKALRAYAATTDDEQLRNDLYAWVGVPESCDTCENNSWDMPQCRECNEQNEYKWYRRAEISNWISVKERLPKDGEYVLAYYGGFHGDIMDVLQWKDRMWLDCMMTEEPSEDITHWQPLPKPPKEEEHD